jgi:hypothetical protein
MNSIDLHSLCPVVLCLGKDINDRNCVLSMMGYSLPEGVRTQRNLYENASRLLVLPLVCVSKCGRFHEPELKPRETPGLHYLGTETVLQREAHQDPLQFGYLKPSKEQSVHSEH